MQDDDDLLCELFGDVIFCYTDDQAIADGVLIPFVVAERDTGQRIATNAWHELKEHYRKKGYEKYIDAQV